MCFCGNNSGQFDAMDVLSVFSILLGYENLIENRQQSAHNDVQAANDKQAKQLLDELGHRLDAQDTMLNKILEAISNETN